MVIYNVTVKVANAIADKWKEWMLHHHLNKMMETGKFLGYRICQLEQVTDDDDSQTFVVQYECATMADYESYISEDSEAMRQEGIQLFGSQLMAFRTIMKVIDTKRND